MHLNVIVLAAGKGTRMKSKLIKICHEVAGAPIIEHVYEAVQALSPDGVFFVVGHQSDQIKKLFRSNGQIVFVEQGEPLGTGHAVQVTSDVVQKPKNSVTIVLSGDTPLITANTLRQLIAEHQEQKAAVTVLTTTAQNPTGYGRILRNELGQISGIVEEKDCSIDEKKITEINSGVYAFDTQELFNQIFNLTSENTQNEFYLTDTVRFICESQRTAATYYCEDATETYGVNSRQDLALVNGALYARKNQKLMDQGVTIIDPATTFVDEQADIGMDTIIHPFTVIRGATKIGENCVVGPHVHLVNVVMKDRTICAKE